MAMRQELDRSRRYWDKHSGSYDRQMQFAERFFGDTRAWLCRQAEGETLEVAVGTGLNLPHYPQGITLTGVDLSEGMLAGARERAAAVGRQVTLRTGNAERLEFADDSFDTVVCAFSLCAVPDHRAAVAEMLRVLRPGGKLLLADHVVSTALPARVLQALIEVVTIRLAGENYRRRPIEHVRAVGFDIEAHDRFKLGIIERLAARKPTE